MKECIRCSSLKEETEFNKDSKRKDGLNVYCKECTRLLVRASYWNDVTKSREQAKEKHLRTIDVRRVKSKEYYEKNKEKISIRVRNRRQDPEVKSRILKYNNELEARRIKEDPKYRMTKRLRSNIKFAIKKYSENGKTMSCSSYGIDFNSIFDKLGPRPSPNHELDHIIPISKFNLDIPEHVRLAHLPCNLQWLESRANKSKSDNIPEIAYSDIELKEILSAIGLL